MQVTAAFARKSYLHLISLITPLLISISTWNLSQISLLIYFIKIIKEIASEFNDFPGEAFLCLKLSFDSNFGMFIGLKKKLTLQSEKVDIHKQYKYCWNSWNKPTKKIFNRFGGVSAFLIYREMQEIRICADTTFLLTCK